MARETRPGTARSLSIGLVGIALAASGCASPAVTLDRRARSSGFEVLVLEGAAFHHRAYARTGQGSRLHVYLEGDGEPFATPTRVAADPHAHHALAFELMALDQAPRLLLDRPCYHQPAAASDPCSSALWTERRYGPEVVLSLETALRRYLEGRPYQEIVFLGYSGGGVLAMLLAERFAETRAVVTVAANLDLEGWTALHGYTPLAGSLDPAQRPPLSPEILQLHLVAEEDRIVPPAVTLSVAERQPGATVLRYPDFDHTCCWARVWPEVLAELERLSR